MRRTPLLLVAVIAVLGLAALTCPAPAQGVAPQAAAERYAAARRAFLDETAAYWNAIADKRRVRNAKRRDNAPIGRDDYVLTQPPVYVGPPRPPELAPEKDTTTPPKPVIPVVADFLAAAKAQFGFEPDRPSELAFKQAYARTAAAAGLTREQVVRIYAFETGGNGTYDAQAGIVAAKPGSRAISPALGYNQLLSTNSVSLLAEHGDRFVATLTHRAAAPMGDAKTAMAHKIAALGRMIAFARTVPNRWSEHDRLAKTTPGGLGIHAAVLDRDIGPLLQMQKLVDSVAFARRKGHRVPLSAVELELMNLTGDGNGFDMVTMPADLRALVPTANFFQQQGYERNPIARRTGTVAALMATIDARMDQAAKAPGARDLAGAF